MISCLRGKMTCTNLQVKKLMKYKNQYSVAVAAAKAGMNLKTARKYIKLGKLPGECKKIREHRTRLDPFIMHWEEIETMVKNAPDLQAKTILCYLLEHYPEHYSESKLRTLQRRLQIYRAEHGKNKAVIFRQDIKPGQSSQSDWTVMDSLGITIAGQKFSHLLFHFILPYSRWESIMICYTESFETLSQGFERAAFELGGTLPTHRTDNLSAATQKAGGGRTFTERWQSFLEHYQVTPTRNNPGQSHENGSIEKSHDLFKNAVRQHLLLRGSRDFQTLQDYEKFITNIKERRNKACSLKLADEIQYLKPLPARKWCDPITMTVRASPSSTIQVLGCTYSVPSRLISYTLRANVYSDTVELYYGQQLLLTMPRIKEGVRIDYRHIIDSLIRKPGAFIQYQYHDQLFPQPIFRWAYDLLVDIKPATGHKHYLKLLQMAKCYGENNVVAALQLCQESHLVPEEDMVANCLRAPIMTRVEVMVSMPNLSDYDMLHKFGGTAC
jgi:transposase